MNRVYRNKNQEYINSNEKTAKSNEIFVLLISPFNIKWHFSKCIIFHILFCLILGLNHTEAQVKTHKLTRDSVIKLGTVGVEFKGGTEISINENESVLAGVLLKNRELMSTAKRLLPIQAGTKVTFDGSGNILSGKLQKTNKVICFKLAKSFNRCIEILDESYFSLFEDGTLQSCVLKNIDGFATTPNGNFILFAAGGKVTFRPTGILQSGFLFKDLPSNIGTFKAWCFIEFDEKGKIIKGVRDYLLPNRRHILDHIELINGKISKAKNNYPCNCIF